MIYTTNVNSYKTFIQGVFKKKAGTFAIKTLFYNILSTVPFKVVPSTGDTPFPTFLPMLECFLERTFRDGTQNCYRIFLNLRVFKKKTFYIARRSTQRARYGY
jgi:hypothetical protein